MNTNEITMGVAGILYPLLRNISYIDERDAFTYIQNLKFVSYRPDPKLSTDQPLRFTDITDEFDLPVDNSAIDIEELTRKIKVLKKDEALGINSKVETAKGTRHIGMIDFLTQGGNLSQCIQTLEEINEKGFVVRSSNAYNKHHFYSTKDLLTESEFKAYMERLRELPSVGPNWTNLQLNQGHALLRISACEHKRSIPYIITHIR